MKQADIQARINTKVSEAEMVDMIRSQPIGTSSNDVRVHSGTLSFSFGPAGVVLTGAEQRKPLAPKSPESELRESFKNGSKVWFVRGEQDIGLHPASIKSSHRLYGGQGHHYEIDCPTFPFIIGFAQDEELFVHEEDAKAAVNNLRRIAAESRKAELEEALQKVESELTVLSQLKGGKNDG